MSTSYTPTALPGEFARLVAEAAMQLPPLTRPQDTAFLRSVTEAVIDIFWSNYITLLPEDVQQAYERAEEEETGMALREWHQAHADFRQDSAAAKRGARVLRDIAIKLPDAMKKEYDTFTALDAVAL